MSSSRWKVITPSSFPWEQEAHDYVRERLPDRDPYRAWTNFEFIADDGTINEVDLLVLTPCGFFLVEIKSRPGVLQGDTATWTWKHEGRLSTYDNPSFLANRKAKKLASLLSRQKACDKIRVPYLDALIFCSAADLQCLLEGPARYRVCLRDKDATADRPARPGIIAALTERKVDGIDQNKRLHVDNPVAKAIARAMDQAGIRPSQRSRRVGDYLLGTLIGEGPGYQDYDATHASMKDLKRRVRLYVAAHGPSAQSRETIQRAAQREFRILEGIRHPGILRAVDYRDHELGAALVFEHDPRSMRLDHFITEHRDRLGVDLRMNLLRQIAEAVKYAHEKKLVHRALSPQCILVMDPASSSPAVQILNWQTGYREGGTSFMPSRGITATEHLDQLVDDLSQVYMAPEALTDKTAAGEYLDVFSLGAIAYHLFSGKPPASTFFELSQKLKEGDGLQISSVLDGAGKELQFLIQYSTHPEVTSRLDSAAEFLSCLEKVEEELTRPDDDGLKHPLEAIAKDRIQGGFVVKSRLGSGACSRALLVERDKQEYVLKVALNPEHNDRLRDESEVLRKLRHQNIVALVDTLEIEGLFCILTQMAGVTTLAERLRQEGKLHLDLLERFGEDLLQAVNYLEQEGIPHRDIKPDNIGVRPLGRGDTLHLALFDFSLSRTPAEQIRAGTPPYLDPFISERKPARWDLHAERFAAAMTLYEMATGTLPVWGDGKSDPAMLDCEVTVESELFEPNLRDAMTAFFRKELSRSIANRFDNGNEMFRAWRKIFESVDKPSGGTDLGEAYDLQALLEGASLATQIAELGLSTRAMNVLDRLNIITLRDLASVPLNRIYKARGVGNKTRREIGDLVQEIRRRFPALQDQAVEEADSAEVEPGEELEPAAQSIDRVMTNILGPKPRGKVQTSWHALHAFLGLDDAVTGAPAGWPSQAEVAEHLDITRGRIGQIIVQLRNRWRKSPSVTSLRNEIIAILDRNGGVMNAIELSEAMLAARGSNAQQPLRSRLASAATRAALETECAMEDPRLTVRRSGIRVLVARNQQLADYAEQLGKKADDLAEQDPLVPPQRVLEVLQRLTVPADSAPLSPARITKLAVAASQTAAVSSRQEIYPRGMEAIRALKLAHGALLGAYELSVDQIRQRVTGRYPEAEPLPDRPQLDELLKQCGWDFTWDAQAARGAGGFVRVSRDTPTVTSATTTLQRMVTMQGGQAEPTPELASARQFEERLQHAIREGAFLALTTRPSHIERARQELTHRFAVDPRNFDEMLIRHLKREAAAIGAEWRIAAFSFLEARPPETTSSGVAILMKRASASSGIGTGPVSHLFIGPYMR